ncbi:MAG TPA: DUF3631 domain-containing protein [Natronosporangium sp.]
MQRRETVGAALLDEVRATLRRYVILPSDHATVAVTLWIAATHGIQHFEHATRLAIHSPVKRCGKSRLLEIIEALCHDPVSTTNISPSALFRLIEKAGNKPPTILFDEVDRVFGSLKKDEDNRDLINIANNGFRRGRPTWRNSGPGHVPTPFSNFAMMALAGIGRKPDTIEDRAVNITMRRRLPGETVEKFRLRRDLPPLHDLRDRLAKWVVSVGAKLEEPVADMPPELEDRAEDAWEPLLAIADAAGGDWPELGRAAAVVLSREAAVADAQRSVEIRLLSDIREVFASMPHVTFLRSTVLLRELRKFEDAPWGDPDFTARRLALLLDKFDIAPRHNKAKTERGYHLRDFRDAFIRNLGLSDDVSNPSDVSEERSDQQKQPGHFNPPGRVEVSGRVEASAAKLQVTEHVRTGRTGGTGGRADWSRELYDRD